MRLLRIAYLKLHSLPQAQLQHSYLSHRITEMVNNSNDWDDDDNDDDRDGDRYDDTERLNALYESTSL